MRVVVPVFEVDLVNVRVDVVLVAVDMLVGHVGVVVAGMGVVVDLLAVGVVVVVRPVMYMLCGHVGTSFSGGV